MLDRVVQTITRHRMLDPGRSIAVAVSGGADSVCLLHVLVELAPRWDLRLSVVHLNHNLRGEESLRDAEFVRELAARLALPVTIRDAYPAEAPANLEQAAREARLAFFRETVASGAAERVAVGHTRSDQAETVLFRFLRGSGSAGLAGIRPVTSEGVIRPLIDIARPDVEQFLRERGIPWREDSTNRSPEFARNRIRHGLLPQLARDWNPAIVETLAHTADWALEEEASWAQEIDRLAAARLIEKGGAVFLQVETLSSLPLAAARRLVRRAMERAKGDLRAIDFGHIAAVLALAASSEGHGRCQPPGLDVIRSFDWLRFARPEQNRAETRNYRLQVSVPGTVRVPSAGLSLVLELIENPETSQDSGTVYNIGMGNLDWERLSGPLEIRNWRPGDQYQPIGSTAFTKIKTLFQEARIPLWDRTHWPILTGGSIIVWARQFGPAAALSAGPDTRVILRIQETE